MKDVIVTQEVLELYDKYDEDFGLLVERWASKKDRQKVSWEQQRVLGEYVEKLNYSKSNYISAELKDRTLAKIADLEKAIDCQVVEILRKRILGATAK